MATRLDPDGWMWSQACELIDQAGRLQGQFFRIATSQRSAAVWEPPVDVFENDRELVVVVAMPGVAGDSLSVTQEGAALVVRGVRPLPPESASHRVRHLEIPYGAFERRIALPSGSFEVGRPQLEQGCLVLRLHRIAGRR
jgi:HSP20 family protein